MRRRNGKRRGAQQKIQQATRQLRIQEKTQITGHRPFWERVRDHPINLLAGLLATFLAFYSPLSDVLREPEIQHSSAQTDDPFYVRFSLHNPSAIFPMTDVRFNCVLERVQVETFFSLVGIPLDDGAVTTIQPGKSAGYECPVHKAIDDLGPILHATIRINVTYKTLWHERTAESEEFNWDSISRQWIKGEIVN